MTQRFKWLQLAGVLVLIGGVVWHVDTGFPNLGAMGVILLGLAGYTVGRVGAWMSKKD